MADLTPSPDYALKEWAVLCQGLAEGRHILLLRKGGIAEPEGGFRMQRPRFWLYPTFVHQQDEGLSDAMRPLLARVWGNAPPPGSVCLRHIAEVALIQRSENLEQILSLEGYHGLSQQTVRSRFDYREPGLFLLALRVYRADRDILIPETAEYAGCKSWVKLSPTPSAPNLHPVLDNLEFEKSLAILQERLANS